METITAYRTSDGKVFEDYIEADAHESKLINLQIIKQYVEKHVPYTNQKLIISFLKEHLTDLIYEINEVPFESHTIDNLS